MKDFRMKITPLYSVLIYIALYIGVLWFTFRDNRASDGPLSFGFPFPLYYGGGMCLSDCGPNIEWGNLLIDAIIFITMIVFIYYFMKKYRNQP